MVHDSISLAPVNTTKRRVVKTDGGILRPRQQTTPIKLKRGIDYSSQRMLKCPERCHFHSLAELYNAALLEGDPGTEYFCPQPFLMYVNGKRYIPDMYALTNGQRYVQEIRAKGKISDRLRIPLEAYFHSRRMEYIVISNDSVYAREIEAQNWLSIVRHLLTRQTIDTDAAESNLIKTLQTSENIALGDIIDAGNRSATELTELAAYRILYRGIARTDLETCFLSYDSEIELCI